jgi:energy-converting hydrogenase Eha subunit F
MAAATCRRSANIGEDTPAAPTVTPDAGYYFTGWDNPIATTVTGDVTYTAQYAKNGSLTITANSSNVAYDGNNHTVTGFTLSDPTATVDTSSVSASGTGKDAGSYDVNFTNAPATLKDSTGKVYDVTYVSGKLTITPKPVTVTANDKSKVYGTADPTLDAAVDGTLGSDTVTYTVTRAAGENVGTYTITPAGEASQGNYSVTYATGTLTITKASADQNAVTATPYNASYDAAAHTISASAAQTGSTLTYSTDQTTWSETAPTWTDVTAAQTVYVKATNPNYEDSFGHATVTITPKAVTVTANDKSKAFGTADPALDATVAGTLGSDAVVYTLSRETGENVGTYAITPAGDATQGNYSVTYVPGTLTITAAKDNSVTATPYSGTYDAAAHTITASAAKDGSTLYYSTDNATWNTTAPTYISVVDGQIIYVKATNPNYEDAFGQATVTITPKPVTVTANDKSKVYGTSDPTLDAAVDGTLGSDTVTYTVTRAAGENVGTYTITPAGDASQGNYSVTYATGTLTITKASADQNAVTATPYNASYDAAAHTISASAAQTGSTLTYSTDQTTWSETAPTWTDVTAAQTVYVKATNPNYEDSFGHATVTITPKAVTVTANDKSKAFGTADPALDATVAGTLGSDAVVYTLSRETGENVGTYAITPAGDATQGNYSVTYVPGTLTITAAKDNSVTATPYSGTYDAAAHTITASAAKDGSTLYYSTDNATWNTTAPTYISVVDGQIIYVKRPTRTTKMRSARQP